MMPETARYLAEGERIVLCVRRHPIVIGGAALAAVAAIAGASAVGVLTGPARSSDPIDVAAGLVALAVAARFGWRLWQWWADRIVVTDRRFLEVSGVLTRKIATMPLTKVTDMTYRRTIGGRILGYGDLIVESAGQDQALSRLEHIPRPDDFYRTVSSLATATLPEPEGSVEAFTGWDEADDTGPLPRVVL